MTTSTTTVQLQEDLSSGDQNAHPSPSRTTPSVGDTKEDARVVIKLFGTWVDVTAWLNDHPGGSKVLRAFNKKDATDAVMAMHTDEAIKRIIRFSNGVSSAPINASIGDVQTIEKSLSREQLMYYKLRTHARNQGWFQSNLFYEGVKAMIAFGLLIIGFATLYFDYGIWSTALIGFAWFQLGWLGHDWSHHTALPKSTTNCANYNDYLGWLTGLARGNTLLWWKLRHNTHHVLTNQYENDPDILTQPPLHFFEDFDVGNVNRYQAVYYLPMLTLLHLFWLYESVLVCLRQSKSINRYNRMHARRDTVALVLHILIVGIISYTSGKYLLILLAYMLSGFLTAVVVFASHYNEPRVASGESLSLVRQTLLTTINIGSFSDTHWEKKLWFYLTGGLNMQIEHHLFPTMPRHNLPKTTFLVKSLAQELGLPYKETNIVSLTKAAVTTLHHNALRNIERLLAR
ncbi:Delta-5/delta-6 fatty acid desaturase, putative [Perkinsus marinus ATCC 50983]|uniref:Delta-5/delta-6 fatty acid desaturase, putative n=1 Tax=Perkinsus marinus (strain ATCC 50983 / TXsc) TaxID=423536 RepID=C5LZ18_PERM5|nr:Delta-5/delta-6 fatty acid desaturase, putative [Perkinsus marinus ATCC 50983]EEQ98027.1 Delta-5/delta-6 fatty acid desaturase, putative [Perkinsus marinus ATCC 50983]|eukprot:XP_002765310.1 Delta-5/delta-6 fatty acid desaturase, putative [Perkinsus marinus ATCC 50983]